MVTHRVRHFFRLVGRTIRRLSPWRRSRFVPWAARLLRTDEQRIELWQRLIITSFVATLAVYGARSAHMLDGVETWWLDRMANADWVEFKAPVTVVAITDRDYYEPDLFHGDSPLDPAVLDRILVHALRHEPRGILLDVQIHPALNESPKRRAARMTLYETIRRVAEKGTPPLVLIRDERAERLESPPDPDLWSAWIELTRDSRLNWADPHLKRSGGFVRSVPQLYEEEQVPGLGLPTVLGVAIQAFGLTHHRPVPFWVHEEMDDPAVPWRIRFSGEFRTAKPEMSPYHVSAGALLSALPVSGARSLLTDRLLLIGGTYEAGRDMQPTVVGDMAGVYVWAEAIGSWIRQDALQEPHPLLAFAVEFLMGVVASLLLARMGPLFGMMAQFVAIAPLLVLFSILTFGDGVLFVNFVPTLFGVYVHYQVEIHLELRNLRKTAESRA